MKYQLVFNSNSKMLFKPCESCGSRSHILSDCPAFNHLLSKNSEWAEALKKYLLTVLAHYKQVHLYTDMGVLTSEGFAKSLSLRLSWKLLPPAVNSTHLKDILGQIFTQQDDYL